MFLEGYRCLKNLQLVVQIFLGDSIGGHQCYQARIPPPKLPPQEIAGLIKGLLIHWFPLIRPAIKPLFLMGVRLWGGSLKGLKVGKSTHPFENKHKLGGGGGNNDVSNF